MSIKYSQPGITADEATKISNVELERKLKRETEGKKKEYEIKNVAKIRAHQREYLLCDCGKYYTRGKRIAHTKTVFHKENINNIIFSQFLDL